MEYIKNRSRKKAIALEKISQEKRYYEEPVICVIEWMQADIITISNETPVDEFD